MSDGRIVISSRQLEYLVALAGGPRTTGELVFSEMVSANSISKAMGKLRVLGLVVSPCVRGVRGRTFAHSLVGSLEEVLSRVVVSERRAKTPIGGREIYYAAILRNGMFTGRELVEQYQKVFPHKSKSAIKSIVLRARMARLCL